ncbi:MAG: box helicase domain protein [Chlorobi bacterium]|nr:box helicase domain protein [Chlorobiota bacterium]
MDQTSDNVQKILTEPENKLPDFTFDRLPESIRAALDRMGWNTPMPVQAKAIPYLLDNRDMIVQSRTGSGKTGAFIMPLLMRIDPERRYPQALVLVPTRELAVQVHKEFEILSEGLGVSGALLYGGVGYNTQLQALRDGAQVIVGTPGRVLDHIGRRALTLDRLRILVFDEADEMLSMGFYPDMREIRRYVPRERSSWMFSATMPYKVQLLAREFLNEPEFLSLSAGDVNISTMEHRFYDVPPLEKDLMLMRLIEFENPESAIIFCNTKVEVEYVATVLKNYGYNADQLSGDLDQKSRERAMGRIRRGETRFLVATDVAARGIDISDLSHVFQYDVPKDPDSYIHRAGRTARAGNTGVVVTLISNMSEKSDLKKIARKYNVEFVELPTPTQEEAETRMAERLTVVMEDRFRAGVTRIQRERMKRFSSLIKSLSENDDERMLLAMLLDDLYHDTFHKTAVSTPEPEPVREERRVAPAPAPQRQERNEGPRPEHQEAPRQDGQPQEEGEQPVDGARKKKKKRKRNRNRNRDGAQTTPEMEEQQPQSGESDAVESPGNEPRHEEPRREEPRREEPRREEPRREEPRREEPRREEPRREESRRDEPRRDEPRREEPRREESRRDEPRREESRREEPKRDEPRREESRRDEPRRDEPRREESRRDEPRREGGRRDEPRRDERGSREPRRDEPRREEPKREEPRRDEPKREAPKPEAKKVEPKREEARGGDRRRDEPRRDDRGGGNRKKNTFDGGDPDWLESIEVIEPEPVVKPAAVPKATSPQAPPPEMKKAEPIAEAAPVEEKAPIVRESASAKETPRKGNVKSEAAVPAEKPIVSAPKAKDDASAEEAPKPKSARAKKPEPAAASEDSASAKKSTARAKKEPAAPPAETPEARPKRPAKAAEPATEAVEPVKRKAAAKKTADEPAAEPAPKKRGKKAGE